MMWDILNEKTVLLQCSSKIVEFINRREIAVAFRRSEKLAVVDE